MVTLLSEILFVDQNSEISLKNSYKYYLKSVAKIQSHYEAWRVSPHEFCSIFQFLSRRYIAHNCENMKSFKCPLKGFQFHSWLRSFDKRISIALSRIFVEATWGFIGNPASPSRGFRKFPSDSGDFLLKYPPPSQEKSEKQGGGGIWMKSSITSWGLAPPP